MPGSTISYPAGVGYPNLIHETKSYRLRFTRKPSLYTCPKQNIQELESHEITLLMQITQGNLSIRTHRHLVARSS